MPGPEPATASVRPFQIDIEGPGKAGAVHHPVAGDARQQTGEGGDGNCAAADTTGPYLSGRGTSADLLEIRSRVLVRLLQSGSILSDHEKPGALLAGFTMDRESEAFGEQRLKHARDLVLQSTGGQLRDHIVHLVGEPGGAANAITVHAVRHGDQVVKG